MEEIDSEDKRKLEDELVLALHDTTNCPHLSTHARKGCEIKNAKRSNASKNNG